MALGPVIAGIGYLLPALLGVPLVPGWITPAIPVVLLYLLQSSSKRLPFIDDGGMAIASLLFLVGVIVFTLLNWRCPNCNSFLGKRFLMKKCDQCGVRLQGGQGDAKRKL